MDKLLRTVIVMLTSFIYISAWYVATVLFMLENCEIFGNSDSNGTIEVISSYFKGFIDCDIELLQTINLLLPNDTNFQSDI